MTLRWHLRHELRRWGDLAILALCHLSALRVGVLTAVTVNVMSIPIVGDVLFSLFMPMIWAGPWYIWRSFQLQARGSIGQALAVTPNPPVGHFWKKLVALAVIVWIAGLVTPMAQVLFASHPCRPPGTGSLLGAALTVAESWGADTLLALGFVTAAMVTFPRLSRTPATLLLAVPAMRLYYDHMPGLFRARTDPYGPFAMGAHVIVSAALLMWAASRHRRLLTTE